MNEIKIEDKVDLLNDALTELGENYGNTQLINDIIELDILDWDNKVFVRPETTKQIHNQLESIFDEGIYSGSLQEEINRLKEIDHELMTASNLAAEIYAKINSLVTYINNNDLKDYLNAEEVEHHINFYNSLACHLDDLTREAS